MVVVVSVMASCRDVRVALPCLACLGKATAVNKERAMQDECMTDHVTLYSG